MLKFADDVKQIGSVGLEDNVGRLKMDLITLGRWAEKWRLKFNDRKCKLMNIGFRNRKEDYALNGVPLGIIKEEKDLGVIISQNLKVGKQCFKAAFKAN